MVQPPQTHNYENYDNSGKYLYFWFDDGNKMGYKYPFDHLNLNVSVEHT